jgi:ERCC4-related helicase
MQQAEAFARTISEVPLSDIVELTGSCPKEKRKKSY